MDHSRQQAKVTRSLYTETSLIWTPWDWAVSVSQNHLSLGSPCTSHRKCRVHVLCIPKYKFATASIKTHHCLVWVLVGVLLTCLLFIFFVHWQCIPWPHVFLSFCCHGILLRWCPVYRCVCEASGEETFWMQNGFIGKWDLRLIAKKSTLIWRGWDADSSYV